MVVSRLRAIVFDFDGVILESAEVKTEAFAELYKDHGPDVVARVREHHLANMGVSRFKKFEWIAENILGAALTSEHSSLLGSRFTELVLQKVLASPFVPGADAAVEQLATTHPLFVASGTPDAELKMIVERRKLTRWFREVHGTPREKPAILRDLMGRHQLTAAEILFVGDGLSDHKAATEVGTEFLARDTSALHDEWMRLGVCRCNDLYDLAKVVAAW